MDATRWLTNTALAYSRRYQVDSGAVYTALYGAWMAQIDGIEALSSHDPDRVRRHAQAALHRWADHECRRLCGLPAVHRSYETAQVRGMLPSLISYVDATGFGVAGDQVKVSGGTPKFQSGAGLAGWLDLKDAWFALPPGQQQALFVVYIAHDRDESGYEALMKIDGITYDTARKRTSRALGRLRDLMGGQPRTIVFVDFEAELAA